MSVEIEAKLKVDDLDAVRARLVALAARHTGAYLETNTFFDTPQQTLYREDRGLRIRIKHPLDGGDDQFVLTYKGPRLHGELKSREEREVSVSDATTTAAILQGLGFARVLMFQKRRESWSLDGCEVELDELPILGSFVEIEGPSESAVLNVQRKLELADRAHLDASYIAMLMDHLHQRGDERRQIMFG